MKEHHSGKLKILIVFSILFLAIVILLALIFFEGKKTYTVRFELDGGTLPEGYWSKYSPGVAFTLPEPTKDGYVFKGWYNNADFDGSVITYIPQDTVGKVCFYAKWISQVEQAVVIVPNGLFAICALCSMTACST